MIISWPVGGYVQEERINPKLSKILFMFSALKLILGYVICRVMNRVKWLASTTQLDMLTNQTHGRPRAIEQISTFNAKLSAYVENLAKNLP